MFDLFDIQKSPEQTIGRLGETFSRNSMKSQNKTAGSLEQSNG